MTTHSGETRSYLVSLENQVIDFNDGSSFCIGQFEALHTEISKKYRPEEIANLADLSGFKFCESFKDLNQSYFLALFRPQ